MDFPENLLEVESCQIIFVFAPCNLKVTIQVKTLNAFQCYENHECECKMCDFFFSSLSMRPYALFVGDSWDVPAGCLTFEEEWLYRKRKHKITCLTLVLYMGSGLCGNCAFWLLSFIGLDRWCNVNSCIDGCIDSSSTPLPSPTRTALSLRYESTPPRVQTFLSSPLTSGRWFASSSAFNLSGFLFELRMFLFTRCCNVSFICLSEWSMFWKNRSYNFMIYPREEHT